ncbi:long-chain fatty acid--CoA ligase [bacterium]|nr:long-chain fatty acid--CoA ligase [bacterium]
MFHNAQISELDWLKKWNTYSPLKTAIKDGDTSREYNYQDFYRTTLQASVYLKEKFNIGAGDRVSVLSGNELEYVFLFFALQRLGAVLVPVNFRLTEREITHIVKDSSPKLMLFQSDYAPIVENLKKTFDFESQQFVASLSSDICFANEIKAYKNSVSLAELEAQSVFHGQENSEVMILYTSGTTGSPKGAVLTHKSINWNSINTSISLNLTQDDTTVIFLPFFHTGGWNVLTTPFLHRGAKLIFLKKFDADQILKISSAEKATLLFGVPTTMDMMARHAEFNSIDISSIRYAIVGGEPMPIELIKTWDKKGIPIRQGFGLTECGPNLFSLKQEDSLRKIGSIGFPNFYVDAQIVDENDKRLGANEVGELIIKGPMQMKEYWKNPSATADTIKNGWLYTGDLVKKDEEGFFYVVGRKKDMYISGAENVYPVEIEQILRKMPGVREAAVIGIPDEKWGEVGRAFVVKENPSLSEQDILNYCLENLAKYKIPKQIVFMDNLPKGDSGKILKKNLPKN